MVYEVSFVTMLTLMKSIIFFFCRNGAIPLNIPQKICLQNIHKSTVKKFKYFVKFVNNHI